MFTGDSSDKVMYNNFFSSQTSVVSSCKLNKDCGWKDKWGLMLQLFCKCLIEYAHPYLHIRTNPILHQYLADLSISSQSSPVQSRVTIYVDQVHLCRTFIQNNYVLFQAMNGCT